MSDTLTLTPDELQKFSDAIRTLASSESFKESFVSELEKSGIVEEIARRVTERSGQSEEIAGLVRLLASRSGDSREDVVVKALTLYGLALDAIEKGYVLAILNDRDEVVREISGFEGVEAAGRPISK